MAHLDDPAPTDGPGANGHPDTAPAPADPAARLRELERENRRLRDEVHALWRTLRAVAPGLAVSEEQLREEIAHAVPAAALMAELETVAGGRDAP